MADLSREWEKVFEQKFQSSADALSALSTRLNLSYHFVSYQWPKKINLADVSLSA